MCSQGICECMNPALGIRVWTTRYKHTPPLHVLLCQTWSFYIKGCGHKYRYPKNLGALGPCPAVPCNWSVPDHLHTHTPPHAGYHDKSDCCWSYSTSERTEIRRKKLVSSHPTLQGHSRPPQLTGID